MSHTFYAEDLGVDEILAKRVAGFMGLSSRFCCTIINPKTWSEHGHVRVYFELWSQNSLNPIDKLDVRGGSYYCAVNNEVYLKFFFVWQILSVHLKPAVRKKC